MKPVTKKSPRPLWEAIPFIDSDTFFPFEYHTRILEIFNKISFEAASLNINTSTKSCTLL